MTKIGCLCLFEKQNLDIKMVKNYTLLFDKCY
jgi:hypothetical protein